MLRTALRASFWILALLISKDALSEDVRCRVIEIDLGLADINAESAHTLQTRGTLFLRCKNASKEVKKVELTLYDGAAPPHRFMANGFPQPVELRFHTNEHRQIELPTDPDKGVIHYRHITPATEATITLPIYPQLRVPGGFPRGEFSIPFTLRVTVAEITM